MSRQLAEILAKDRIISAAQLNDAVEAAKLGKSHVEHLIQSKAIDEVRLLQYLSQKFGLPSINLAKFEISPEIIKIVPVEVVRRTRAIPIQSNQGVLVVAVSDPSRLDKLDEIKFVTKLTVEAVLTTYSAFDAAIAKYYGGMAMANAAIETFKKDSSGDSSGASVEQVQVHEADENAEIDAPVIAFVNSILVEAIRRGASDVHVEPYEKRFRIRMRIDGAMIEVSQAPLEMRRAIVARLKVMSRMDIAESRIPQDGRIKLRVGGSEVDFRVSTMPTIFGEKVVLRILSKGNLKLDLEKLGFEAKQLEAFKKGIYAPNGMVLVTGPTGSGKTTTLYSALSELNKVQDNISTVEDPVEYNLEGINQVQINKDIGLTFASVLRTLLRQDPDTILVGEIRDYETAEVAIQAALTGHLVLSTLHTNDAPSTITRLMNMGIEPFLIVASLNTVVAQRLLRGICPTCRVPVNLPQDKLVEVGMSPEVAARATLFRGKGCNQCSNSGYRGRMAIYEVFDFSLSLKELVLRGATSIEIRRQAVEEGMSSLRDSALAKVAEGKTTLEEAMSLTLEN
ncbi:type IV-A pilus assembly ATPase PilB [bacterium]|nr:type IV-A pilus assembly ATPase PilB [bacterium]